MRRTSSVNAWNYHDGAGHRIGSAWAAESRARGTLSRHCKWNLHLRFLQGETSFKKPSTQEIRGQSAWEFPGEGLESSQWSWQSYRISLSGWNKSQRHSAQVSRRSVAAIRCYKHQRSSKIELGYKSVLVSSGSTQQQPRGSTGPPVPVGTTPYLWPFSDVWKAFLTS